MGRSSSASRARCTNRTPPRPRGQQQGAPGRSSPGAPSSANHPGPVSSPGTRSRGDREPRNSSRRRAPSSGTTASYRSRSRSRPQRPRYSVSSDRRAAARRTSRSASRPHFAARLCSAAVLGTSPAYPDSISRAGTWRDDPDGCRRTCPPARGSNNGAQLITASSRCLRPPPGEARRCAPGAIGQHASPVSPGVHSTADPFSGSRPVPARVTTGLAPMSRAFATLNRTTLLSDGRPRFASADSGCRRIGSGACAGTLG